MTVKSATRSTIENNIFYRSMLAGNTAFSPEGEFLLEEVVLSGSQASVTFDVSSYAGVYQNLQIRYVSRSNRADTDSVYSLKLNGTTSTYRNHQLYGDGSTVLSNGQSGQSYIYGYAGIAGNTLASGTFSVGVIDILDAFSSNKNTTTRSLQGIPNSSYPRIVLQSGLWVNTASLTSIEIADLFSTFVTGSRFSLYGEI